MYKKNQQQIGYSINPSQAQNPVWKHFPISNKINDTQIADFLLPDSKLSILFISLEFFYKFPLYLKGKIEEFVKSVEYKNYSNRILLCLNDSEDVNDFLTDIMNLCYNYDIKVLIGFCFEDIANYLRAFKYNQNNPINNIIKK